MRVNPAWIKACLEKLADQSFTEVYSNSSKVTSALVIAAAKERYILKVINLGAGAQRIIKADNVCPHCKGTGKLS